MALEFRQTQKQVQKLLLTPQMQQSLQVLQMTTQELKTLINQELENNPVLEEAEGEKREEQEAFSSEFEQILDEDETGEAYISQPGDAQREQEKRDYRESLITKPYSIQEELRKQLAVAFQDQESRRIGEFILGNLNESGFLEMAPSEIAETLRVEPEKVEKVLNAVQHFEPPGIGAGDLRETLLIQLEHAGDKDSLAYRVVEKYLPELGRKRYAPIAKSLKVSLQAVKEAHERISRLQPRPWQSRESQAVYLTPDLIVSHKDGRYELSFVNEGFPSIRINPLYKKLLRVKTSPKETREFLRQRLKEALVLIRCLNQRRETIAKVVRAVMEYQKEFLERGVEHLKPLTLKEVAEVLGCHESTVSRVVTNKVIETPHGSFPLKFFFDRATRTDEAENSVASKGVMALIEKWIRGENHASPLSDQEVVERLKQEGFHVARRTVAKYRQILKILPSYLRKK